MGRLTGRLFVGLTLSLICFIAYSSQIFIIWPWYGRELSVELLQLLVPFNILVAMLFWNYALCVMTDPGSVPDQWSPDFRSGEAYEVKKLTGGPRYCRSCGKYKPPRAHHCRQCNRCVLRMDHHCPWVNNCVGHFNYGHFIRFLFYVDIACSYHMAMVTRRVYASFDGRRFWDEPSGKELIFIVLNYTACIPVLLSVGIFSLYHFYCLSGNTTTIEGWEKDKVATLVRRGKIREIKFPYHLGIRRNIASVLGNNPLLWCCPTVPPGTGLKYQLAEGDDPEVQQSWPPQDPAVRDAEQDHQFRLPSTPWTYESGLNPNLHPSNARHRKSSPGKPTAPVFSVPPYHPDYDGSAPTFAPNDRRPSWSSSSSAASSMSDGPPQVRVRRGSEGYEVRPIDREQLLQQYIATQAVEPGRYNRYVPEEGTPSSQSEDEIELLGNETTPLTKRVEEWQAHSVGAH